MITIKEYAEKRHKTVQAVHKQLNNKKNRELLKNHVFLEVVNGREVKVLDDFAVQELDAASLSDKITVQNVENKEQIKQLEDANKAMMMKLLNLQDLLIQEKEKVIQLTSEQNNLIEFKAVHDNDKKEIERLKKERDEALKKIEELQNKKKERWWQKFF